MLVPTGSEVKSILLCLNRNIDKSGVLQINAM